MIKLIEGTLPALPESADYYRSRLVREIAHARLVGNEERLDYLAETLGIDREDIRAADYQQIKKNLGEGDPHGFVSETLVRILKAQDQRELDEETRLQALYDEKFSGLTPEEMGGMDSAQIRDIVSMIRATEIIYYGS